MDGISFIGLELEELDVLVAVLEFAAEFPEADCIWWEGGGGAEITGDNLLRKQDYTQTVCF